MNFRYEEILDGREIKEIEWREKDAVALYAHEARARRESKGKKQGRGNVVVHINS